MRKALIILVPVVFLAGACARALDPVEETSAARVVQDGKSAIIPGSVIVQMDEDQAELFAAGIPATKAGPVCDYLEHLGTVSVERLFPDAGEWEPRHREAGLHRWFRVTFDPSAEPATKAAGNLSLVPGIVFAEPERRVHSTASFNDPYWPLQWVLQNDGSLGSNYKAGCDINVAPVWEYFTGGNSSVIVAVVDSGVQLNHPDLAAVTIPGGPNGSRSFVKGHTGYTIYPDDHGTHVAGAIAAVNNNEIGVCGVAGGLDGEGGVRILSCPFLHKDPEDPDHTIQGDSYNAIIWAADHGAVICNNSWGHDYETEADALAGNAGATGTAIDYFIKYAGCDKDGNQRPDSPMKGGVVFFAAGNESWQIAWPAAYENAIAVGAVSAKGTRAYYSNYGDWVDICAPGGDARLGTEIYCTVADDKYGYMQGTSMACPLVSGVAALIVSHFGGPGFTNEMLKERLLGGANADKAPAYGKIGPMVDALGSFSLGSTQAPDPTEIVSATSKSNEITVTCKVTADPDAGKAYGYLVLASMDAADLEDLDPRKIPASVKSTTAEVGSLNIGDLLSVTMGDLEFDAKYYASVVAYDYAGNYSALSALKSAKTQKNNPPVISTEYKGDYRVKPFETLSTSYSVEDPDGHKLTIEVTPGSEALASTVTGNVVLFRISGNAAAHGVYTAHILATDAYGASTDYQVEYEILENHAPRVVSAFDDIKLGSVGETLTFDLTEFIRDEDGEPLKYAVSLSEQNVAHPFVSGDNLTLTTLGFGLTTVTITATDACGKSCSISFFVLVRDESRPVDLYPNPVVKTLNIRPGTEGQIEVSISNKAGATVWSGTQEASPFAPLAVDMSGLAGGTYYVSIKGAGIDDVYPIAKL